MYATELGTVAGRERRVGGGGNGEQDLGEEAAAAQHGTLLWQRLLCVAIGGKTTEAEMAATSSLQEMPS